MAELDFKKLGLKCGLEIHQQLDTQHKLFCSCRPQLSKHKPVMTVTRKIRAVAGELGEVDIAAVHEALKDVEFHYQAYPEETCLVELDEEPPHDLNAEALEVGLKIAILLNCEIPDELHVMRKTVVDGSNTTGFQRTVVAGMNGYVETLSGKVGISSVALEEESCQIISKGRHTVTYGLDRLGIPLIEIGTHPDITTPEQAREVAEKLGMILRSTGKARRGIGTIRQDLNVSIKGGARVEIKGFQELKLIPRTIENEMARQSGLISKGQKVAGEVRKAEGDGSTSFLRPLPGSARLYPETDIPPIPLDPAYVKSLGESLPEAWEEKIGRYQKDYGLNKDIATQLVKTNMAETFDGLLKTRADPGLIAATLTSGLTQIRREGAPVERLGKRHFQDAFAMLADGRIAREALLPLLKELAENPGGKPDSIIRKMGIESLSVDGLRILVKKIIEENRALLERPNPEKALMGLVMKEARGRVNGETVMKVLKEEIEKHGKN
ncbi:MAG: Glu-tRNA(Gln) amidotransferase subunit GatE [Candidatus Aenigmarchaeota archaeon]|nr:Glu-tRNA(Gln) amidotransferase subunit GatE [Candidatus Aenigmarchaeota archaeon]